MPRSIAGCFAQQNIGEVSVGRRGYKNENKTANDSPSHAIVSTGQCTITNHKKSQEKPPSKRKMQGDTYPAFAHVRAFPIGQSPYIIYPQNGKYIIKTYTTFHIGILSISVLPFGNTNKSLLYSGLFFLLKLPYKPLNANTSLNFIYFNRGIRLNKAPFA